MSNSLATLVSSLSLSSFLVMYELKLADFLVFFSQIILPISKISFLSSYSLWISSGVADSERDTSLNLINLQMTSISYSLFAFVWVGFGCFSGEELKKKNRISPVGHLIMK